MQRLDSFEQLCFLLQTGILVLAPSLISRGCGSSSDSWKIAQLRWLWPQLQILGFWEFSHGSGDDPRHREAFRLRLKYLDASGQNALARAVQLLRRIAGQEDLGSRDDVEWPRQR